MSNTGNTLTALFAGAAVGVGLGILFAPDKGSVTRGKLKENIDEATNALKYRYESATEDLRNKFANAKYDIEDKYEDLVSNVGNRTEDVISFLETKLADLKERNNRNEATNYKEPNTPNY